MEARPYTYHLIKSESGMRLVLLVASSGEGKTTACLKVVELAQNIGLRVA